VRRFAPNDSRFVAELAERAFAEYGGHPSRYTLRSIERSDTRTWLAVEAGVPVGMVVLELVGIRATILALAVVESARGRGIGRSLMQTAEREAQANGAERLSLCTADSNLAALDLFLRRGFRIVHRRPGYYARRQTACELAKALTP
jgi:ribosomal protein S18 acetylase RimI-like enzyme